MSPRPGELRPTDLLTAFFALGVVYLVVALVVGLVHVTSGWAPGRWVALHLAFIGGISQLVLGASQFFAAALLATSPPPRAVVRAQLVTWNAGTVSVVVGTASGQDVAAGVGGVLLVLGLGLLAVGLRSMRHASLQRAPWATRWYEAAAGFLAAGVVLGVLLALDVPWRFGSPLAAHLTLNVGGWFGCAIVGTLHTLYPSLTETSLRFPRLQRLAFAAWTTGVAALAAGYGLGADSLAALGWGGLALGAGALAANLLASTWQAPRPFSLPTLLVAAAQCMLPLGLALALVLALGDGAIAPLFGSERVGVAALLLAGWLGLTVMGSLLHLLTVLVRASGLSSALGPSHLGRERALAVLAAASVLGVAAASLAPTGGALVLTGGTLAAIYVLLLARAVTLAARIVADGGARV